MLLSPLYSYRRKDLLLEVFGDRIVVREVMLLRPCTVMFPLDELVAVRCQGGGWLQLDFGTHGSLRNQLGLAAQEVCDLVAGLL